ncbi:MFS transporter [Streptomyces sp. TLI_105]|uniref:MFS transporter n=1 Tax=Streptomyces sp. TLI_105 TaxID=1881019 RepID=UPI00089537DF|nr:MFS transporter [Streptomyces sp. TLI_105]SEC08249.1 Predicted arabinose efflux permease, MFS family [Streptomyces sp. TLI_105]
MSVTSPVRSPAPTYAAVLRTPHARRAFGAALLGRLSNGVTPLSLILSVRAGTGSYAVAGTVMAVFGLTGVLLSPARAALVDRFGPRRALVPLAAGSALLLVALAVATARTATPPAVLVVLAAAAGALPPPLGPVTRALFSGMLTDRDLLRRAYSLDTVAEELLFVTGPLLVGLLVRYASAPTGLAVSAALVLTGTLGLVTSPVVRGGTGERKTGTPERAADRRGVPGAGLLRAAALAAGVGMCLGAVELLVIAFADAHHRPGAVPWAAAALSAGSAVGGLLYGAVPWRVPTAVRLSALALGLGAVLAVAGLSPHPYALVGWVALGGLFVAPAITSAYLLADESVEEGQRTRAGAWVNTAFNAGTTAATAGAGLLVGRLPLPLCFALAALPAVLPAVGTLGGAFRIRRAVEPVE